MQQDQPQENVIADYAADMRRSEIEGLEIAVRKSRRALFWAGGILLVASLIDIYSSGLGFNPVLIVFTLIECGIFIALGFWTKQKPFTAVVTGLCYFLLLITLNAIVLGYTSGAEGVFTALFGGIIFKIIIIVNLIMPIGAARELQRARKEQALLDPK